MPKVTSRPKKRKRKTSEVARLLVALTAVGCGDRSPPPLWPQPPPPTLSEPIGVEDDEDEVQASAALDVGGAVAPSETTPAETTPEEPDADAGEEAQPSDDAKTAEPKDAKKAEPKGAKPKDAKKAEPKDARPKDAKTAEPKVKAKGRAAEDKLP